MQRNKSIDGLKYILIILVVLGHFIEPSRYEHAWVCGLYSVIYSFHMPLFVFLSGYFYKPRSFKEEFLKCIPLMEVCVISHLVFASLTNPDANIKDLMFFDATPSWYLLSFVTWRILSSIALNRLSSKNLLLISVVVSVLSFILIYKYGGFISIMRTLQYYPYFAVGYFVKEKSSFTDFGRYKPYVIIAGVLALLVVIFTSCRLQHVVFFQRDGLYKLTNISGKGYLYTFLYRYILIACGLCVSSFVFVFLHNNSFIQRFAIYGQGTLFIYFGQTLLYPLVNRYCSDILPSLIAVVIMVVVLTYLADKTIAKLLMNPISTTVLALVKRKKEVEC